MMREEQRPMKGKDILNSIVNIIFHSLFYFSTDVEQQICTVYDIVHILNNLGTNLDALCHVMVSRLKERYSSGMGIHVLYCG
jgi:hypothetical protein